MKNILITALFFLINNALAGELPLLVKFSTTGAAANDWAHTEKCEIFSKHVSVTKTYGEVEISYEIPFSSDESLTQMILMATQEKVQVESNGYCNGPSTFIKANIYLEEHAEMSELLFYATGGCGYPRKLRQGPFTSAVIDLTQTFCPTTH